MTAPTQVWRGPREWVRHLGANGAFSGSNAKRRLFLQRHHGLALRSCAVVCTHDPILHRLRRRLCVCGICLRHANVQC
eukprot:3610814-Pyramimonas_sp.AAC.2